MSTDHEAEDVCPKCGEGYVRFKRDQRIEIAQLRAEIAEMHERSDSRDDAIEGEGFVRGLERAKEIAESLVWQAVDAIAAEIAKAGKPLESELPKPSEIRGLWKKVMIAALIFMYFMDSPTYHWITVTQVSAGTWTDGVDTWQGLPGCKSAGMPIGDECKGLTPQVPSEFSVS